MKGETIFLCPWQSDDVLHMLHHFESARSLYPLGTRAIIVLPNIDHVDEKKWKAMLDKYQIVHEYPIGTYLYSHAPSLYQYDNVCDVLNPITWHVTIYLVDFRRTIEDRLLQANNDANKTANEIYMIC